MKKQLFSLVMMLALVVLAGTNSWAQSDATLNESTVTYTMITGSTHTFTVTRGRAGSTLAWEVYRGINTTTSAAADFTMLSANAAGTDFQISWNEAAAIGNYTIEVTETNPGATGGCSTVRRFYVSLIDFDVIVYASDDDGNEFTTAAQLATCGDGSTVNYGNEATGEAFNNVFNTDGDLDAYTGDAADDRSATTDGFTERYVTVAVVWNSATPVLDIPDIDHLVFDYTATVNHDLINVNGVAGVAGTATAITIPAANRLAAAPTTRPAGTTADAYTVYYYIPLTFADRWLGTTVATDITATFYAGGVGLYDDSATPVLIGTEPVAKEVAPNLVNTSAEQTIYLAPATSTISVN